MRLEGVYPAIDRCPRCGRLALGEGIALVVAERTYVCRTCAPGGVHLSGAAVGFLRASGSWTPSEAAAAGTSQGALQDLEQAHERLIALHLEKEVRSLRVLKELRPEL